MQVQEWLKKLGTVSEIMEQWFQVQNVWTYMEAVFSGGDIVKQLPTEAKRFQNIDKNFMKIVQMAAETGNTVDVCNNIELIKTMLPHLQVMFWTLIECRGLNFEVRSFVDFFSVHA